MKKLSFSNRLIFLMLGVILLIVFLVSLFAGTASITLGNPESDFILFHIRLPRTILALLVGVSLSLAGAVFQALLRNPLADPHLLGISAGGALGVVIGSGFIAVGSLAFSIPVLSFLGSFLAVLLVYRLSLRKNALSLYTLLLVGVMLNSFFVSIIIFLQTVIRSDELITILFWLLGNLSFSSFHQLVVIFLIILCTSLPLFFQAKKINVLSLGESTAQTLGVSVESTKRFIFVLAAILTGTAVSASGMIGFVGLVVPHLARLLFGSDYRKLLPASALLGGILLIASDSLARVIIAPQELPVGVVTSFLGAPFFIYFLKQRESKRVI